MDVKDYCKNLASELTVWKAKVYDIIARLDKVSSGEKEKIIDQVRDIHVLFVELDDRISRLERECPTEWGSDKIEIEQRISTLGGKIGYLKK